MHLVKVTVAFLFGGFLSLAMAGSMLPYDQKSFDKLAMEGKPVVLAIHASWCPTCKAQAPIQTELMAQALYKDVTMMTIDFDSQKSVLTQHKVTMQSTMVAYRGGKEVGRSVGDTSRNGIEGLIQRSVK